MTLRINHNEMNDRFEVEYFSSYSEEWRVCEDFYMGRNTFASFMSMEEAKMFMNWKYEKSNHSVFDCNWNNIPSDYYGVRGRYYGD